MDPWDTPELIRKNLRLLSQLVSFHWECRLSVTKEGLFVCEEGQADDGQSSAIARTLALFFAIVARVHVEAKGDERAELAAGIKVANASVQIWANYQPHRDIKKCARFVEHRFDRKSGLFDLPPGVRRLLSKYAEHLLIVIPQTQLLTVFEAGVCHAFVMDWFTRKVRNKRSYAEGYDLRGTGGTLDYEGRMQLAQKSRIRLQRKVDKRLRSYQANQDSGDERLDDTIGLAPSTFQEMPFKPPNAFAKVLATFTLAASQDGSPNKCFKVGIRPRVVEPGHAGHAIGVEARDTKLHVFDPNVGEFEIPYDQVAEFFVDLCRELGYVYDFVVVEQAYRIVRAPFGSPPVRVATSLEEAKKKVEELISMLLGDDPIPEFADAWGFPPNPTPFTADLVLELQDLDALYRTQVSAEHHLLLRNRIFERTGREF